MRIYIKNKGNYNKKEEDVSYIGFFLKVLVMMATETFRHRCYLRSNWKFDFDQFVYKVAVAMVFPLCLIGGLCGVFFGTQTFGTFPITSLLSFAIGFVLVICSFTMLAEELPEGKASLLLCDSR